MLSCKIGHNQKTFHCDIKNLLFQKDAFVDFITTNYVNMIIYEF